jgi:hypothetical protein
LTRVHHPDPIGERKEEVAGCTEVPDMKRLIYSYSRPRKLSDTDTVVYEIDMLRFAATKLHEGNWREEREAWVYLEEFLLHFRNLIEFLGKERPSGTDLHITTIWKMVPAPDHVPEIYEKGKQLLSKYEPKDADGGGRISLSEPLHHQTNRFQKLAYR